MTVRKRVVGLVVMGALLSGVPGAVDAQKTTEQFIPVGQSPGVSGNHSVIGKVQAVNARDQTVTIAGPTGTVSAKLTERTKIWLDRSKIRQANVKGTLADLRPGVTVEVKLEDPQRGASGGPAEWIKAQIVAAP